MNGRSREESGRGPLAEGWSRSRTQNVRVAFAVPVTVGVVLVALVAGIAGVAAADPAASSHLGSHSAADQGETPLEAENGTVELVVRFDPVEDPAALGETETVPTPDANATPAVADLRDHAAAEQAAFESFAASRPGVTVERDFWLANALLVSVDAENVTGADLRAVENVTRIHENVAVEPIGEPAEPTGESTEPTEESPGAAADANANPQIDADPSGRAVAGVRQIDAPAAWERFDTRGAGATVAVVDTGVDPGHRDVELGGWASFDENGTLVSDDVADASDPDGHGTHVAGTVAGGNASGTYIGVAPEATLYGIDAFEENETATFAGVVAAMEHATVTAEADVLQLSLGANGTFRGFVGPVRNARATGTVVVAAVGNEGPNASSSPANAYDSVAVGAVDDDGRVPPFSGGQRVNASAAFGEYPDDWPATYVVPDATAPGVRVASAAAGTRDSYVFRQGTSMAAPHVSGVAALAVAATDDRAAAPAIESALVETAVHPENATAPDYRYGHGVVDAPAAVATAVEATPPEAEASDANGTEANRTDPTETDTNDSGTNGSETNGTDGASDGGPGGEHGDTDDGAPGFGAPAAVVAVALASLTAVARAGRG